MKKVLLIALSFLMNGCLYWGNGCWRPIVEVISARCTGIVEGTEFPNVAGYQKKYTLGKTDSQQRWRDLVSCGGKYGDLNLTYRPKDVYIEDFYKEVDICMEKKGYIYISDCGYQEAELNKGVCNL